MDKDTGAVPTQQHIGSRRRHAASSDIALHLTNGIVSHGIM